MAQDEQNIKAGKWHSRMWKGCVAFADAHGRLGWYIALFGVTNIFLNLVQIVLQLFG